MFVFDTNALIYFLKDDPHSASTVDEVLRRQKPLYISAITELELFSYPHLTKAEYEKIEALLQLLVIIPLDSRLARIAGELRRAIKIETPDSVIAATALLMSSVLVTRNVADFRSVPGLELKLI